MLESIFNFLSLILYENFWLALLGSFLWGVLSIVLSPCHLSSIPLIIGFIISKGKSSGRSAFSLSLVFSLGILLTIALIGIVTASLGRIMGDVGDYGNYAVALVFFVVGLYMLDVVSFNWSSISVNKAKESGLLAALILGILLGIGLGPCTFAFLAPVLGIVFQTASESWFSAVMLITAFGMGHCGVIIAAGTASNVVQKYLDWSADSKALVWVKRICGVLIILAGFYFIFVIA